MVISDLLDRIRLLFVTEKKPFLLLKSILGFYPHNIRLYETALMHKSVSYHLHEMERQKEKENARAERHRRAVEKKQKEAGNTTTQANRNKVLRSNANKAKLSQRTYKGSSSNNERLEFLGDAVLGAIVADILYRHYGNKQEGFLTNLRSKIVCRKSLNKLATDLGLDKLIRHVGAVTTGHNSFMSGNAFEAFVGAIYIDRGYNYCYRFLEQKVFSQYIDIESVAKEEKNHKSNLIEWCQKNQYTFEFRQKESRDATIHNAPVFHSSVFIMGIPCGTGDGYSKKESDQNAAQQALTRIKKDKELLNGIKNSKQGS